MRARQFFYISAGLFLLAGAYSLGTRKATAQSTPLIEAVDLDDYVNVSYVIGRTYYQGVQCGGSGAPWCGVPLPAPLPGTSRVVATKAGPWTAAVLENGDVYAYYTSDQVWRLLGNLHGNIVQTDPTTWGRMKKAFRN